MKNRELGECGVNGCRRMASTLLSELFKVRLGILNSGKSHEARISPTAAYPADYPKTPLHPAALEKRSRQVSGFRHPQEADVRLTEPENWPPWLAHDSHRAAM